MRRFTLILMLGVALALNGCAGMTDTQQRTLSGAAIGTAGGAAIGAMAGNTGLGALIGAGVGTAGGYIYDQNQKSKQRAYEQGYSAGQKSR